jgi:hypothetical protein
MMVQAVVDLARHVAVGGNVERHTIQLYMHMITELNLRHLSSVALFVMCQCIYTSQIRLRLSNFVNPTYCENREKHARVSPIIVGIWPPVYLIYFMEFLFVFGNNRRALPTVFY